MTLAVAGIDAARETRSDALFHPAFASPGFSLLSLHGASGGLIF
jgi:hypothetical protein